MVTIRVAAEITGLTVKGIRFYEKIGLISPAARSPAGYRLYSEEDIYQLQQIHFYRKLEFPLEEVAELLNMSVNRSQILLTQQVNRVENRIQELEYIRQTLSQALGDQQTAVSLAEGTLRMPHSHTAVIGIDLQNDFLDDGAMPCKRIYHIIPPLSRFLPKAREKGIPIIYVCDSHHRGDLEFELWVEHAVEGTWGAKVIKELTPCRQDYVVKKNYFNGFFHTNLQKMLKKLKINTIVLVGWRTHVCIAQTAIEAYHQGYQVIVAEDGVESTTQGEHKFGLNLLRVNYAIPVIPCETILEQLEQADHGE